MKEKKGESPAKSGAKGKEANRSKQASKGEGGASHGKKKDQKKGVSKTDDDERAARKAKRERNKAALDAQAKRKA